jgi:hypothetical protein
MAQFAGVRSAGGTPERGLELGELVQLEVREGHPHLRLLLLEGQLVHLDLGQRGGVADDQSLGGADLEEVVEGRLPHVAGRGGGLVGCVDEAVDVLEGGDADGAVVQLGRHQEPSDVPLVGVAGGGGEAEGEGT